MMAEADSRGAKFEGIITEVPADSGEQAAEICSKRMKFHVALIVILACAALSAVIWLLLQPMVNRVYGFVYGCVGAGPKFK